MTPRNALIPDLGRLAATLAALVERGSQLRGPASHPCQRLGKVRHIPPCPRQRRRRAAELGMRIKIGCHTFRATGITAYLDVMQAAHWKTRS